MSALFVAWYVPGVVGAVVLIVGEKAWTRRCYPKQWRPFRRINLLWALTVGGFLGWLMAVIGPALALAFTLTDRPWSENAVVRWLDQPVWKP